MSNIEPISQGAPAPALNASGITPAFATPGTVQLAEWAAELDYAHKLGTVMAHSNFLPQSLLLDKNKRPKPKDEVANDAAVVILAGKSGLDPLQSVQNIFPVHGQPSMYAGTMGVLVVAMGHETRRTHAVSDSVTWKTVQYATDDQPTRGVLVDLTGSVDLIGDSTHQGRANDRICYIIGGTRICAVSSSSPANTKAPPSDPTPRSPSKAPAHRQDSTSTDQ